MAADSIYLVHFKLNGVDEGFNFETFQSDCATGARPVLGLQSTDAAAGLQLPGHQRGPPLLGIQRTDVHRRAGLPFALVDPHLARLGP